MFLPLLLSIGTALQAAPRAPTAGWNVQFDDAQCVAQRPYGSAGEPIHLVLKAPPVGDVMQIAVVTKGRWTEANQVAATIGLDGRPPLKANLLRFSQKDGGLRIYTLNMSAADFQMVRGARTLSIAASGLDESFELSQLGPLLKVMEECVADLRRVWNVTDPSGEQSPLASRARANLAALLNDSDYPAVALDHDQSGIVRFVVLVDEMGRVADCTVIQTSGAASLDAQTCAIVKSRAKYKPALGPDGKPAKDAAIQQVIWRVAG